MNKHMKWHNAAMALVTVLVLSLTIGAPAFGASVTTADGGGADAWVTSANPDLNRNGNGKLLEARFNTVSDSRMTYLRWDLSSLSGVATDANMTIMVGFANNTIDYDITIWGLNDGNAGEGWGETTVTWNNAPGNDPTVHDLNASQVTLLGTLTGPIGVAAGDILSFSDSNISTAFLDFINADTDGQVTLIMTYDNAATEEQVSFMSKEDTQTYPSTGLTYAPTLDLPGMSSGPPATIFEWQSDDLGSWAGSGNWSPNTPNVSGGSVPNDPSHTAVFGGAISGPTSVVTNTAVTVKDITFDNSNSYIVAGAGSVTLESNSSVSMVSVLQGDHQFQAVVNLANDATVDASAGTSLSFNNALNLNGNNLSKTGDGDMFINNALNTGGGIVSASAGVLGGVGLVSNDLENNGGTIAPGTSMGTLSVGGNFTQNSGNIEIEIGGTVEDEEYDVLSVVGEMMINGGDLDVVLVSFSPSANDTFDIFDFGSFGGDGFDNVNLAALAAGLAWDKSKLTTTGELSVFQLGDMDGDGDLDTDDVPYFVQALVNRTAYDGNGFGVDADLHGDVNENGVFDFGDIASFNTLLSSAAATAVPEPASAGLLVVAFGVFTLVGYRRKKDSPE